MAHNPKKPGSDLIYDFKLITMANYAFKIITKILSDRLGGIASQILFPKQTGFMRGRHIHISIALVSECYNILDCNITGGNVGIKFDITKAFDTIDWGFLLQVLRRFGFADRFVGWIDAILHSACLSIAVNGIYMVISLALEGFFRVICFLRSCFILLRMC